MEKSVKVRNGHVQYGDARIIYYFIEYNSSNDIYFHSHYNWEMHFSETKQKTYMLESGLLEVGKKELLIIGPGTVHGAMQDPEGTYVLSVCLEKVNGEKGFYKCFKEMLECAALQALPISDRLLEKVKAFCCMDDEKTLESHCQKHMILETITHELFMCIGKDVFTKTELMLQDVEENTELLLEIMLDEPNVELKDIAEAIGYSVRHTARLIEKNYHLSLLENRRWKSLKNAARLIKIGKLSPEEIAVNSGFVCVEDLYQELEKYEQLIQGKKERKG